MSVEGPIIAMQRSPSLSIDPPSHHVVVESPLSAAVSRPMQMLAPQLRHSRERAQSVGDVAPHIQPSSVQPVRRAKSPLVSQVGMWNLYDVCMCNYFGIGSGVEKGDCDKFL